MTFAVAISHFIMMKNKVSLVAILGCILLGHLGCINPSKTKIKDLYSNPHGYDGRMIQLSGEVKDSVNIIALKYYVIKDETGEIPVITKKAVPPTGKMVQVTGKVSQTFAIGNQSYMVIFEE
jgi:hypothetical protein